MISWLYSTVAIITALAYIPQMIRVARSKTTCHDISIPAWLMWSYTSTVSLLYAAIEMHDLKFSIVMTINAICINTIIAITLYKSKKYATSAKNANTD